MSEINSWKVLLIDDEPDSLDLIHDMLALHGADVQCANNGTDGLAILHHYTPTLVIVDLSMPKPDGWDVLHHIRSRPDKATLPVLAITAYSSEKVIVQAQQAGFNALLPKPIRVSGLLAKLKEVVGKSA